MPTGVEQQQPRREDRNPRDEYARPDYGFWDENLLGGGAQRPVYRALLATLFRHGCCDAAVGFVPLVLAWIATELIRYGKDLSGHVIVAVLLVAVMVVGYGVIGMVYRYRDHGTDKERNEEQQGQAAEHPDDDSGAVPPGAPS